MFRRGLLETAARTGSVAAKNPFQQFARFLLQRLFRAALYGVFHRFIRGHLYAQLFFQPCFQFCLGLCLGGFGFGLWLGFHLCTQDDYLAMIDGYCAAHGVSVPPDRLRAEAIEWQATRGARSGRVAWQFFCDLAAREGVAL